MQTFPAFQGQFGAVFPVWIGAEGVRGGFQGG